MKQIRLMPPVRRTLHREKRRARRGYVLVMFGMMLFGIMALAALVIDVGFARLSQRQLQSAAEAAAIEGMRGDGLIAYEDRRDAAADSVSNSFDDDLDAAADDGAFDSGSGQFGAGPLVDFSGGAGAPELAASQLMTVDPGNPVFKPQVASGSPAPSGFRVDLLRGAAAPSDSDLYATGPAIPYLFARGSLLSRELISEGIVVRGSATAEGMRALSVGLPHKGASPVLEGLTLFALELSYWNALQVGVADTQTVALGEIGGVGRFFATASASDMPLTVGRTLPEPESPGDGSYSGFVAIYSAISDGATTTDRIVGFARATAQVSTGMLQIAEITKLSSVTAQENASTVPCYPVSLLDIEWAGVLSAHTSVDEPLRASTTIR